MTRSLLGILYLLAGQWALRIWGRRLYWKPNGRNALQTSRSPAGKMELGVLLRSGVNGRIQNFTEKVYAALCTPQNRARSSRLLAPLRSVAS